jgi:hypothetical protein
MARLRLRLGFENFASQLLNAWSNDLRLGQRNPLSYQQDKIVDFYHLKADSGDSTHSCAPQIVAGLAGGKASSERADPEYGGG